MPKGIITNFQNKWSIIHNLIDPYSQLTNPIEIHPEDIETIRLTDLNRIVKFQIVLFEKKHFAKLK